MLKRDSLLPFLADYIYWEVCINDNNVSLRYYVYWTLQQSSSITILVGNSSLCFKINLANIFLLHMQLKMETMEKGQDQLKKAMENSLGALQHGMDEIKNKLKMGSIITKFTF